jgi:hypothetical protein
MLNLPEPPPPPLGSDEALSQLAAYYRSLVEYHHKALAVAHRQLDHIEALLNPNYSMGFETNIEVESNEDALLGQTLNSNNLLAAPRTKEPESESKGDLKIPEDDSSIKNEETDRSTFEPLNKAEEIESNSASSSLEETSSKKLALGEIPFESLKEKIAILLEENRGIILHIDYIIRKISRQLEPSNVEEIQAKIDTILHTGQTEGMWFAVPDSPNCWTIDLNEFPDFSPNNNNGQLKQHHTNNKLPPSEKLVKFGNLGNAILGCLRENAPEPVDIKGILDWIYPDELPSKQKEYVYFAIARILSKGNGTKGWQRVKTGLYASVRKKA